MIGLEERTNESMWMMMLMMMVLRMQLIGWAGEGLSKLHAVGD